MDGKFNITLPCPQDISQNRTQLSVLRAMRLQPGARWDETAKYVVVHLKGWVLTHATMSELSGLPVWASWLDFSECEWPLEHTEYRALAQHVPTSYVAWVLPGQPGSALLESIIAGISERRAGLSLERVELMLPEYTGGPQEQGEHVLLRKPW